MCRAIDCLARPLAVLLTAALLVAGLAMLGLSASFLAGAWGFEPAGLRLLTPKLFWTALGAGGALALGALVGACGLCQKRRRFLVPSALLIMATTALTGCALFLTLRKAPPPAKVIDAFSKADADFRADVFTVLTRAECAGSATAPSSQYACRNSLWVQRVLRQRASDPSVVSGAAFKQCVTAAAAHDEDQHSQEQQQQFCLVYPAVARAVGVVLLAAKWVELGAAAVQALVLLGLLTACCTRPRRREDARARDAREPLRHDEV